MFCGVFKMATNCQEEFESVVSQINIKTDVWSNGHTNPKSVIFSHFYRPYKASFVGNPQNWPRWIWLNIFPRLWKACFVYLFNIKVLKWRNKTTSSINNETIGTRGWRQPFSELSAPLKSLRELWYNKWAPDHEACSRIKQETVAGNNLKNVHHKFYKVQSFTLKQNHFIVRKKILKADFPHDDTAIKHSNNRILLSRFLAPTGA